MQEDPDKVAPGSHWQVPDEPQNAFTVQNLSGLIHDSPTLAVIINKP